MTIIATKSFQLATYQKGDENASRLALILPGRLDTKDYVHMTSLVDYLAATGYLALSFDPPGTWESPGDISLYSTSSYIQAVNELIDHFGNRPTVLVGHSRGSTVSILAGTSNPAVLAIVPIAASYGAATPPSTEALAAGTQLERRDVPPGTARTTEKREFSLPVAYFQDALQYNAGKLLEGCSKPKLLIYCDQDEFTPANKVEDLFEKLPEPKALHKIHSEHDYRLHANVVEEVNQTVSEFLEKL